MAWFIRFFKAIETFAEQAYKKPIWYFWTIFVGGCFMFWISYQASNPDEQARLEKSINEREVKIQDDRRLYSLNEQITAQGQASIRVLKQFLAILPNTIDSGQVDNRRQQIEENNNLAIETRKQAEHLIARVKGTQLRVPIYNDEVRMYETLLANEISMLTMIEDFCAAYLAGDAKEFAQQVHQTASQFPTLLKELETTLARNQSLKLEQESILKSDLTENERAMAQARIHRIKGYLQFPALGFSIIYVITIGVGVCNSGKKSCRVVLPEKRVVVRPKKRGKKR